MYRFPSALTLIWAVFGLADREDFNSSERSATVFGNGLLIVWNVVAIIILSNIMVSVSQSYKISIDSVVYCHPDCNCN